MLKNMQKLGKKNICFTGMMGSGKSAIGKKFAKIINYRFFDIDKLIQNETGKTISQIFEIHGEDFFRKLEEKIALKILKINNSVISLGGGSILNKSIRNLMVKNSFTIYLEVNIDVLYNRLQKTNIRPLLKNKNIKETLQNLQKNRNKYYKKANLILNNSNKMEHVLKELKDYFQNYEK